MLEAVDPALDDVLAAPDDDAPRLVWADALLEQGDARGELVVVQCALARGGLPRDRSVALRRREQELLANARAWSGLDGIATNVTFRRGFVDAIEVTADVLLAQQEAIFAKAPLLRRVRVRGLDFDDDRAAEGLARIERVLAIDRIRHLALPAVARWVSPPWGELSSVETVGCEGEIVASLCRTGRLRSLTGLTLEGADPSVLQALAASPDAGALDELDLEGRFGDLRAALDRFVPPSTRLRPRAVRLVGWRDEGLGAAVFDSAEHAFWSRVEDLTVERLVSPSGAARSPILASKAASRLRRLRGKLAFTAAESSLLDTPTLASLEELALAPAAGPSKVEEPKDLTPLFHSRHLRSLRSLALRPFVGPDLARAVVRSPLARQLEVIDLRDDWRITQIRPELEAAFDGLLLTSPVHRRAAR